MAHFARINPIGLVMEVQVVNNEVITDNDGVEHEEWGVTFLQELFGEHTKWVQTSYNGAFRANYAAIGGTYDSLLDVFIPPQPYPSWVMNDAYQWDPPVPAPGPEAGPHRWEESLTAWVPVQVEI